MAPSEMVVWLIKRDFRLLDNQALASAVATGKPVLPLCCLEPSVINAKDGSDFHLTAKLQALEDLRASARRIDADVFVTEGEVIPTLARLHLVRKIGLVVAHEEIGAEITFCRDRALKDWCQSNGIEYREFSQSSVKRGGINRDKMNSIWRSRITDAPVLPTVTGIPMTTGMLRSAAQTVVPRIPSPAHLQPVSERDAQRTLEEFLTVRSRGYRRGISSPNSSFESGSRLSVHLAWGTISTRFVYHATANRIQELANDARLGHWVADLRAFLSRLHWRDHFIQRLESEPAMEFQSLHPAYRGLPYENDPALLDAWLHGRTGFPIVDAVMRCLRNTGFVNFRMRAMVVSFACHALHLDWRLIHPGLAGLFLDYEPGIHLSQLQMQAGVVGLNTIRVYSPTKQLMDQDPRCEFVRTWLPELRDAKPDQILAYESEGLREYDYPPPVVNWRERAGSARRTLYSIKAAESGSEATQTVLRKHGSRRKARLRRSPSSSLKRTSGKKLNSDARTADELQLKMFE